MQHPHLLVTLSTPCSGHDFLLRINSSVKQLDFLYPKHGAVSSFSSTVSVTLYLLLFV
jgi:hypothetical protein